MLLSAVKLGVVMLAAGNQQLSTEERSTWTKIQPSLVFLLQGERIDGIAALIDDSGLFLTHRRSVTNRTLTGRLSDGKTIQLSLVDTDEPTQLTLLKAADWKPGSHESVKLRKSPASGARLGGSGGSAPTAKSSSKQAIQIDLSKTVIAALPSGSPMRAELVALDKIGVVNPARRVMSLSEFQFEAPAQLVGGALVFSTDGELMGVMGATLDSQLAQQNVAQVNNSFSLNQGADLGNLRQKAVGPNPMTIAYSVGPEVLQRVIVGFKSPSHKVEHPALGLLCRNEANDGGAHVESVQRGSPAEKAGLRAGDVIVEMDGVPIKNQVDYARFMLRQTVGSKFALKVNRLGLVVTLSAEVGM